jgi:bifunctional non-homologous end joining protein LigD
VNLGALTGGTLAKMDESLLPQQPIDANAEVLSVEWLFEPLWPGVRMLARRSEGRVRLTDEHGQPIAEDGETADAAETLADAILADEALVDGVWTAQPFVGDGSPARAWAETLAAEGLASDVPDPLETERRRAFVAIDLVELEGMPLHDVPFQERRRLLESVIDEGIRVRLSQVVKQPLAGWLVGWRANGFTHYVAKHMNSRYRPGERTEDWLKLSLRAEVPRGFVGRMMGGRGDRVRRVRD